MRWIFLAFDATISCFALYDGVNDVSFSFDGFDLIFWIILFGMDYLEFYSRHFD